MSERTRSWWGWGWEQQALPDAECLGFGAMLPGLRSTPRPVPRIADLDLPAPRIAPPAALADRCSDDPADRAAHAKGQAYRDVVRTLRGRIDHPPDLVARPRDERDVIDLLDWAAGAGVAVIPFGGGSSVVGGVEYRGDEHGAAVALDLTGLDRVLEVDPVSQAARIQGGALGPVLEDQLREHGLTLRHFPQSFEFSTLGGWLATRAGGHFATVETHIDDLVESMRVVTPSGISASRRLPGSGAGPSPDRLFLGSEGTLGVITEAWMRVRPRPDRRASASVRFDDFDRALDAARALAQSGLRPANCRLLDPGEAQLSGAGDGRVSVLVLGFESFGVAVDERLALALELAADHGGIVPERPAGDGGRDAAADAWRATFLRMPYVRDGLARMGAIAETFETAITWDRIHELCRALRSTLASAIDEVCGAPGLVNCRLTHVYPDGAAPYFTVIAPARPDTELESWDALKVAVSEVLDAHGATITHHHAVGRDHRPWYDRQRPEPFAAALGAAKRQLDPAGILNPGVVIG
ncbi:FAD-binding oxidoreductase [Patulibacter defluvii]|uniref:FAD-binding oxidoreductase n=1 Tax=Patulibacter defluvii TaxID=3095358 RepID=UPI002A751744|nr:FAD-binding oxidoreductase [Patulibacter sp. DM4]